ncbi:hypothetical protein PHMEG_00021723 [Phytophthora megakarya]|uniref:Uncharacterized protein n=1 Tax=Phytophthora megakarya TaxID=4795 RepID=A0A225VL58_9STRA|nr:hypothetical protein PHMEG_00021723 [Phytophthora megakarya]
MGVRDDDENSDEAEDKVASKEKEEEIAKVLDNEVDTGEDTGGTGSDDEESAPSDAHDDSRVGQDESRKDHHNDSRGTMKISVDPTAVWHASWEAWNSYFDTYKASTMQVLPVRETMKRGERNKRLLNSIKGGDASKMVPEGLDPYQRVYICTHGWKTSKSRGDGSRPRQHIQLTSCPFGFTAHCNLERMELQVKNGIYKRKHPISSEAYATYPIFPGVNVVQVDVDNMVRAHNSSMSRADGDDATAREIAALLLQIQRMYPQSQRRSYHNTNRFNYQLLTFMTMNEFG